MAYRVRKVERLPSVLDEETVYVSEEYELAALKCACGCEHRVTLLLNDGHTVTEIAGLADISPSIGVWDAECKSHFFIRRGKVIWGKEFSDAEIRSAMRRQLASHVQGPVRSQPWYRSLAEWILNRFRRRN
jgi:hypothetical protein